MFNLEFKERSSASKLRFLTQIERKGKEVNLEYQIRAKDNPNSSVVMNLGRATAIVQFCLFCKNYDPGAVQNCGGRGKCPLYPWRLGPNRVDDISESPWKRSVAPLLKTEKELYPIRRD
jgi:hypothetical protein